MTGQLRDYPVNRSNFIYHRDIGFPSELQLPEGFMNLRYTKHARERQRDKYNNLKVLPTTVNILKDTVVEVHTDDNVKAKKLLIRINYDKKRDIVMALELIDTGARVITFWLNYKKDQHLNLDKTKYTHPHESCNA